VTLIATCVDRTERGYSICLRAGWCWGNTVDLFGGGNLFEPLPESRRPWLRFFVVAFRLLGPISYKAILMPVCYNHFA